MKSYYLRGSWSHLGLPFCVLFVSHSWWKARPAAHTKHTALKGGQSEASRPLAPRLQGLPGSSLPPLLAPRALRGGVGPPPGDVSSHCTEERTRRRWATGLRHAALQVRDCRRSPCSPSAPQSGVSGCCGCCRHQAAGGARRAAAGSRVTWVLAGAPWESGQGPD